MYQGRTEGANTPEKMEFARSAEDGARLAGANLAEAVAAVQPTALIGAAAAREAIHAGRAAGADGCDGGTRGTRRAARRAGAVQPLRRRRVHCSGQHHVHTAT